MIRFFYIFDVICLNVCKESLQKKYGGNPVVYIVKPIGQFFNTINTEYIADKALVVSIFPK